jgi:hypothetical protein
MSALSPSLTMAVRSIGPASLVALASNSSSMLIVVRMFQTPERGIECSIIRCSFRSLSDNGQSTVGARPRNPAPAGCLAPIMFRYEVQAPAPAVLGISPWVSPYQLWLLKTGRAEPAVNAATRHGTALEPLARHAYEVETGNVMRPLVLQY